MKKEIYKILNKIKKYKKTITTLFLLTIIIMQWFMIYHKPLPIPYNTTFTVKLKIKENNNYTILNRNTIINSDYICYKLSVKDSILQYYYANYNFDINKQNQLNNLLSSFIVEIEDSLSKSSNKSMTITNLYYKQTKILKKFDDDMFNSYKKWTYYLYFYKKI